MIMLAQADNDFLRITMAIGPNTNPAILARYCHLENRFRENRFNNDFATWSPQCSLK